MATGMRLSLSVREHRAADMRLAPADFAAAAGITPGTLDRLIRAGLITGPSATGDFSIADLVRLRRMLRVHDDLGVNLIGAAIILDLIERLDELQDRLGR